MKIYRSFFFYLLWLSLLSCNQGRENFDLVIVHCQVVDVKNGAVLPDRTVAIRNDTIIKIVESPSRRMTGATTIDASGQYLIPGLWDMHVHFRGGDTLIEENKNLIPLYLAHGVTTVRDAGDKILNSPSPKCPRNS